ncbi:two-component system sensor histidine kinase DcuS [Jeotgalibacillus sp. S-D1]|uniref:DcuS/MalK family sensor histidine kinase n=1 Tax=Jeotgalibacillus sp. S-D1 TaxID=2552189 RepID=UPI0010599A15|nr:DcuS/MalK family sensor histidine kinase [Jeotgalibacillus sp. S-D1]TDL30831.1 two-component system sensor histidine kinase DcuS [Jeotgalibacillus sp. S-D1]
MKKRQISLRAIIIMLVMAVVAVSLATTDVLISRTISEDTREEQEEKGLTLARLVAQQEEVQNGLLANDPSLIQPYAERVRKTSGLLFVVVMDMEGIRLSHPDPSLIGESFEGNDETKALAGEEYSSTSQGTLSPSLRTFTPVYDEAGEQIGVVAVGDSLTAIEQLIAESHWIILSSSVLGIAIGVAGAFLIAWYIRRILHGQEPAAIAKTFEERNRMLQSVREGIIAVDQEGIITLVNDSGRRLFAEAGLPKQPVGMRAEEFLPGTGLTRILATGEAERDEELHVNHLTFLINRMPLTVEKEIVGAISTFRDKTEVNALAEQLTGVKLYSEALRAQSHEMKNKLHVILGLLRTESYRDLKTYIYQLTEHQFDQTERLTQNIKDPVMVGFLIGKLSYAREKQVSISITCPDIIPPPSQDEMKHHFITVLGNLIDNALDAAEESRKKNVSVKLTMENETLHIEVADSGPGIPKQLLGKIFEKAFSTKGDDRGYGLYLVRTVVQELGGTMTVDSFANSGTTFHIEIKYEAKETDSHD